MLRIGREGLFDDTKPTLHEKQYLSGKTVNMPFDKSVYEKIAAGRAKGLFGDTDTLWEKEQKTKLAKGIIDEETEVYLSFRNY